MTAISNFNDTHYILYSNGVTDKQYNKMLLANGDFVNQATIYFSEIKYSGLALRTDKPRLK